VGFIILRPGHLLPDGRGRLLEVDQVVEDYVYLKDRNGVVWVFEQPLPDATASLYRMRFKGAARQNPKDWPKETKPEDDILLQIEHVDPKEVYDSLRKALPPDARTQQDEGDPGGQPEAR